MNPEEEARERWAFLSTCEGTWAEEWDRASGDILIQARMVAEARPADRNAAVVMLRVMFGRHDEIAAAVRRIRAEATAALKAYVSATRTFAIERVTGRRTAQGEVPRVAE